jgi:hypothetical protein
MTRKRLRLAAVMVFVFGLAAASIALASGRDKGHGNQGNGQFRAKLIGFGEVPANNTAGHGRLRLTVSNTELTFRLDYADLSGPPLVAHIHVGQKNVNGGVSVFFCGGGGQAACPGSASGSISGTITAANVVGPTAQGYDPGDLAPVVKAIRAGVTYANMHTTKFPGGEIRGQVRRGHGGGHH